MKCRLSEPDLAAYLARQIRNFFPDGTTARTLQKHIARSLPAALVRMSEIFEGTLKLDTVDFDGSREEAAKAAEAGLAAHDNATHARILDAGGRVIAMVHPED